MDGREIYHDNLSSHLQPRKHNTSLDFITPKHHMQDCPGFSDWDPQCLHRSDLTADGKKCGATDLLVQSKPNKYHLHLSTRAPQHVQSQNVPVSLK